jgi:hypothetical protein
MNDSNQGQQPRVQVLRLNKENEVAIAGGPHQQQDAKENREMDEGRVRYHARRRGFYVMETRGLEHKRREAADVGTYMLLAADGVALFTATLEDIAAFLARQDKAKRRQSH